MSSSTYDDDYALDMLIAARGVVEFVEGLSRSEFDASRLHQLAIVKQIEIIGEAASRTTRDYRDARPAIPWQRIIGRRHKLVHDYRRIDLDVVWDTATSDVPALIPILEVIVPPDEEVVD